MPDNKRKINVEHGAPAFTHFGQVIHGFVLARKETILQRRALYDSGEDYSELTGDELRMNAIENG
jgi:hypothetical protein